MSEILDEIEHKNTRKRFSKLSFITSLLTLGFFSHLTAPRTIKASESLSEPSIVIVTVIQVFCLAGIVMTILSFTKKEPSTWFKWLGGVLNVLLFLLLVGAAIFARVV